MIATRPIQFNRPSGFTLIEVLVASVLCGMMAFVLLALMRASEELALKGKAEGAVATILERRGSLLLSVPYSTLATVAGTTVTTGSGTGNAPAWFLFPGESTAVVTYVTWGKPLPGTATPRGLTQVVETLGVTSGTFNGLAGLRLIYTIQWTPYPGGTPGDLTFDFIRYDNNQL